MGNAFWRTKSVEWSIADTKEPESRLRRTLTAWDLSYTPYIPRVLAAAFVVFFAFIGFDVVATTAEEARNPQRDLRACWCFVRPVPSCRGGSGPSPLPDTAGGWVRSVL